MDPKIEWGIPEIGQKARLLTGAARWFWNSIGWISPTAVMLLGWINSLIGQLGAVHICDWLAKVKQIHEPSCLLFHESNRGNGKPLQHHEMFFVWRNPWIYVHNFTVC